MDGEPGIGLLAAGSIRVGRHRRIRRTGRRRAGRVPAGGAGRVCARAESGWFVTVFLSRSVVAAAWCVALLGESAKGGEGEEEGQDESQGGFEGCGDFGGQHRLPRRGSQSDEGCG